MTVNGSSNFVLFYRSISHKRIVNQKRYRFMTYVNAPDFSVTFVSTLYVSWNSSVSIVDDRVSIPYNYKRVFASLKRSGRFWGPPRYSVGSERSLCYIRFRPRPAGIISFLIHGW